MRLTEEQMNRECKDIAEVELPKGQNPVEFFENMFGGGRASGSDLIDDVDVEKTIEIKIR